MFCWHKYKTGDIRKYQINGKLMKMSPEIEDCLRNHNELFIKNSNGVGSEVGFWNNLIYHLIPDSVVGINITGESDLHDNGFEIPSHFKSCGEAYKYFQQVNTNFLSNMKDHFMLTKWKWLRRRRMARAEIYYYLVESEIGWISFMDGKRINKVRPSKRRVLDYYNEHQNDTI